MFPRRCKKCRCYIAPQLARCPRCGTEAPPLATKPTKEDRQKQRATMDDDVPVLRGKRIHWVPSDFALQLHGEKLRYYRAQLEKAETASERNTARAHIRSNKEFLARKEVPDGKEGWTTQRFATKHGSVVVFVDPKGRRYVIAGKDDKADLIVVPADKRHRRGMPAIRLQQLESSPHWRAYQKQEREDKTHEKRATAKKKHRAKKRGAEAEE
jgi:hypothetical protein